MFEYPYISESHFVEFWGATTKANGDLFFYADLIGRPLNRIWTIYEIVEPCNKGGYFIHWCAQPAIAKSIALGYVVTEKPWGNETPHAIWYLDDDDAAAIERDEFEIGYDID